MNSAHEQALHARWFPGLLKTPIGWACDCPLRKLGAFGSGCDVEVDRAKFFSLSDNTSFDERAKLFPFSSSDITQASIDYLKALISPPTLLVGYELSEPTRDVLNSAGLTYIDIWLHPVRFYDDVMFAFSSNHSGIQAALNEYELDSRLLELRAVEISTAVARRVWRRPQLPPGRGALFVGQTRYDKALLADNRMLSLQDFRTRFESLARDFDFVLYRRHPMVHSGDSSIRSYFRSLGNVAFTNCPTYYLLADPMIERVASISSSVVHESVYFGKGTDYFFRPPIQIKSNGDSGSYATVFERFLTPQFWQSILKGALPVKDVEPLVLTVKPSRLRDALGVVYGYQHVDRLEEIRRDLWWIRDFWGTVSRRVSSIWRSFL